MLRNRAAEERRFAYGFGVALFTALAIRLGLLIRPVFRRRQT